MSHSFPYGNKPAKTAPKFPLGNTINLPAIFLPNGKNPTRLEKNKAIGGVANGPITLQYTVSSSAS